VVLAGLKEAWQPLRYQWLGERVLLAFEERAMEAVALRRGAVSSGPWQSLLPAQALDRGMPILADVLGDFLGDLLLSKGLIGQPVSVALPAAACCWRVIEWPFAEWPDAPLEALRTIAPDLRLPFALEAAALDLQPLPGQPLRSLLVAAHRDLVDAWSEVFGIAGTPLQRLQPAQACLRQALLPALQATDPRHGVVLLLAAAGGWRLVLWHQGVPLFERLVPASDPAPQTQLLRLVRLMQRHDPGFLPRRLWLAPVAEQPQGVAEELARALDLDLEPLAAGPYDSLLLQGLAEAR
jgi:Tfp pilus assembly PilM family ATPase